MVHGNEPAGGKRGRALGTPLNFDPDGLALESEIPQDHGPRRQDETVMTRGSGRGFHLRLAILTAGTLSEGKGNNCGCRGDKYGEENEAVILQGHVTRQDAGYPELLGKNARIVHRGQYRILIERIYRRMALLQ
jgi:hypothetical protein